MAVFNDPEFFPAAVQSILSQSWGDFEFVIIDDACTDSTMDFLDQINDPRIRVIRNPLNQGLTRALQKGVNFCRGSYLARMDSDDVALPDRLQEQVAFMEAHPDIGILGGCCLQMNIHGKTLRYVRAPVSDLEIRWVSLLNNPFIHSTVVVRRSLLDRLELNYDEKFTRSQDYDLWSRLLRHTCGANLDRPLIYYRVREGVTHAYRNQQLQLAHEIALRNIGDLNPEADFGLDEVTRINTLLFQHRTYELGSGEHWTKALNRYEQLYEKFKSKHRGKKGLCGIRYHLDFQVLKSIRRCGFPSGSGRWLCKRLLKDPFWILFLSRQFASGVTRRIFRTEARSRQAKNLPV